VAKTVPYQEKIGPQSRREPTLSESWKKDVLSSNLIEKDEFGNGLRSLISSYTGVALAELQDSESMTSMGIDSLGAIELADELQSKFGIIISTDDLLSSSMAQLLGSLSRRDINTPPSAANSEPSSYLSPDIDLTTPLGRWTRYKENSNTRHRVETLVYKEVEDIEIHADVMVPLKPPSHAMPIGKPIVHPARKGLHTDNAHSLDDSRWWSHDAIQEGCAPSTDGLLTCQWHSSRQRRLSTLPAGQYN
jgi:acyl carrier protein